MKLSELRKLVYQVIPVDKYVSIEVDISRYPRRSEIPNNEVRFRIYVEGEDSVYANTIDAAWAAFCDKYGVPLSPESVLDTIDVTGEEPCKE